MAIRHLPRLSLAAFALAALTSCSSVQWVPIPDLDVPVEDPHLTRVCVARPGNLHLSGASCTILDDGVEVGELKNDGHLIWERAPGPAIIGAGGWEYSRVFGREVRRDPVDLPLELEAGRTYTLELTPVSSWRSKKQQEAPAQAGVARGHMWELRIVDDEEAAQLLAKTSPAKFEVREVPDPEIFEGPGFSFPIDPRVGELVELDDGSGVAMIDSLGHALAIEWADWSDRTLPTTYAELEELVATRLSPVEGTALLHIEPVEHTPPLAFFVTRVAEGSSLARSGGLFGASEQLDAVRGMLAFPHGQRLYFLTWVESELFVPEPLDETTWEPWRARLLEFLGTIEFEASTDA